jgi:carbamoyltransferase
MRDRVNRIKHRELWRPLAPVVIAERASEFFDIKESPYMLFAARVKPEVRTRVPAITHVDFSARPQTVRSDQNPKLYSLLKAFEQQTGLPVLLNTSFNDANEPIVARPEEAVRTFLATELDLLVCEDFVVRRA